MTAARKVGKYELIRRVGVGGMAEVYEAALQGAAGFSKRLALKLLLPHIRRETKIVEMFIDEATIAAELDHPNIVCVFDFGEIDGEYYMAMEYVDGWDLRTLQQRLHELEQVLPVPAAVYIVRELCRGLDYIHHAERKVIHRDVTPHNLFVARSGQVKLGDFGVAKSEARLSRTEEGEIKGKLAYLAPEQVTGDPITERTDVYAAGLILYELITGQRLINATGAVNLIAAAADPPAVKLPSTRTEALPLERTVQRALQRHAAMRHQCAMQLAAELEQYLEQQLSAPFGAGDLAAFIESLALDRASRETADPLAGVALGTPDLSDPPPQLSMTSSPPEPTVAQPGTAVLARRRLPRRVTWWQVVALLGGAVAVVAGLAALLSRELRHAGGVPQAVSRQDAADISSHRQVDPPAPAKPPARSRVPGGPDARASFSLASRRKMGRSVRTRRRRAGRSSGATAGRRVSTRTKPKRPGGTTPPRAAPVDGHVGPAVEELRQRLHRLRQQAYGRGLWPGDDPQHDREVERVARYLAAKQTRPAVAALKVLRRRVEGFRISKKFARAKMARLERAIGRADLLGAERQQMALVSQSILRHIMAGRLVEASRAMSGALARLKR